MEGLLVYPSFKGAGRRTRRETSKTAVHMGLVRRLVIVSDLRFFLI